MKKNDNLIGNFQGKKFSKEDKKAIVDRVTSLIKERVSPELAVDIMNAEGFRRVDGEKVTLSWVTHQYKRVKMSFLSKKTRHLSGPVKTVYENKSLKNPPKEKVTTETENLSLVDAIMVSNMVPKHKIELCRMLGV